MVVATARQLLLCGKAAEAAAALQALHAAGQPLHVARVAAAAAAAAVDSGARSAAAAVAACNVLLWRGGAIPLLRDVQVALARQGRADAAAAANWHALQRGEGGMVAGVSAAVLRSSSAREVAELAAELAHVSGCSPAVTAALAHTMAAAARAGSSAEAAAVAAQLLALGAPGLLRSAAAELLSQGVEHAWCA